MFIQTSPNFITFTVCIIPILLIINSFHYLLKNYFLSQMWLRTISMFSLFFAIIFIFNLLFRLSFFFLFYYLSFLYTTLIPMGCEKLLYLIEYKILLDMRNFNSCQQFSFSNIPTRPKSFKSNSYTSSFLGGLFPWALENLEQMPH